MSFIWIDKHKKIVKKSKESQEILERLEEYLKNDKPVKILRNLWNDQSEAITYHELRDALMDDSALEELLQLWAQDYSVMVTNHFREVFEEAMLAGAANEPILQSIYEDTDFKIDITKPNVLRMIDEKGSKLVTNLADVQRNAINSLLTDKILNKHSVDELARFIRPCIGLTTPQIQATRKLYAHIQKNLLEDHPRMKRENAEKQARKAAIKYAEKQHRYRADTIAISEMAAAYNEGAYEAIRQAQDEGLMGKVKKQWSTARNENVCKICSLLEGVEIEMEEYFDFKGSKLFGPPAHPRCACAVKYVPVLLNQKDIGAIIKYISPDAYVLNEKLRNGVSLNKMEKEWTDSLDQALDKMPTYRGMLNRSLTFYDDQSVQACLNKYKVGEIVREDSYFSCTKEGIYNPDGQIQIWVRNSKKGRNLVMYNEQESEILYPKGSEFQVLYLEEENGTYNIILEEA